jgi:serine phosphatase RsbU (regulator of sigma subunit)
VGLLFLWYYWLCLYFGFVKNRTRKLEKEKEKLEKVVEERTAEVVKQKHLLEEKNKEVMDSITYARRIQQSLMPTEKYISRILGKKK